MVVNIAPAVNAKPSKEADPQYVAYIGNILFTPILGSEDGAAAGDAEKQKEQQHENLVCQSNRGNRYLPQLADHQTTHQAERR